MKQGDFTQLASNYHNRPGYSNAVLDVLCAYVGANRSPSFVITDVGAGTGKLTEMLAGRGYTCVAVEPNDAMREEGKLATSTLSIDWRKGFGEETGLSAGLSNWLLMASSFHWVDPNKALPEFARVLKPGGFFTALWNPRDLKRSDFHMRLEEKIHSIAPNIERKSSGSETCTEHLFQTLTSTGHFKDVVFVEAEHEVVMTPERFIGAWRSVNDIQAQAGPKKWEAIMQAIVDACNGLSEIVVPYRTRAWTAKRT